MLLTKKVIIRWHYTNKEHYQLKGYKFTKYGDELEVEVSDLSKTNKVKVKVRCDYCGCILKKKYVDYIKQRQIVPKDCCKQCSVLKLKDVCQVKYGVDNVNQLEETTQKKIETCRKNYGVDFPGQSEEVKEKMVQSRIKNLGVEWAMQNEEVKFKTRKSFYKNGTGACSKPQEYLCYLLDGELNYPIDNCNVDILLHDNIIIEYDGGGHDLNVHAGVITQKEFENNERKRDYFLKSQGYKIIRIKSPNDYLPSDEKIKKLVLDAIQYMYINNTNHFNINFSDKIVDIKYGQLRRISEKDIETLKTKKNFTNVIKNNQKLSKIL